MTLVDRTVAEADRASTPDPTAAGWVRRLRSPLPPRLRALAPVLVAVVVAGVLHVIWWRLLATAGGDIAAQDAWAAFARTHPGSAYNLAWYGGIHPVSYSVLSPYLMATLGVRSTMVVAGTLSAGLLAWLLLKRAPDVTRPTLLAVYGAVALTGNAVSGRATFGLGILFGLVALCAVLVWPARWPTTGPWRWLRGAVTAVAAVLTTAASPVAGLFLGMVAATLWLARRHVAAYVLGVPPVIVVALSAWLFPFSGEQPMAWSSTILPAVIGASVVVLVPTSWRAVRLGGVVYLAAVVLAWVVPSPVGTNIARLGLLFGGVVLVAAAVSSRSGPSVVERRYGARAARTLLVLAIVTATIWQVAIAARDAVGGSPPASWSVDLDPLVAQLDKRDADQGRVEVVPTRSHREAAALAPYVNLARGWNRQADAERNPIFYADQPLTAAQYRRWLHRWAVRYVVLSTAAPDPAAEGESQLVADGLPYLRRVWSNVDWTLFAVVRPTPLVSPPASVLEFDAAEITLFAPTAGPVVVRIPDSPWLSLVDEDGRPLDVPGPGLDDGLEPACLSDMDAEHPARAERGQRDDWLVLHAPRPGTYRIAAPYKLPRGSACG